MAKHRSFKLTTTPKDAAATQPFLAAEETYSDRPRRRWVLWLTVVGTVVVTASVIGGILVFTAPFRAIARSGPGLRPEEVVVAITRSVWWTYFAIATGIIGLGVTVTGVIGWFIRR